MKIEPSLNNGGRFLAVAFRRVFPTIPMARAPSTPMGNPFRNVLRVKPFLLFDIWLSGFEFLNKIAFFVPPTLSITRLLKGQDN